MTSSCIFDLEIEPLCVFVSVQVILQPQFVWEGTTKNKYYMIMLLLHRVLANNLHCLPFLQPIISMVHRFYNTSFVWYIVAIVHRFYGASLPWYIVSMVSHINGTWLKCCSFLWLHRFYENIVSMVDEFYCIFVFLWYIIS